jgi:hypothetical protein
MTENIIVWGVCRHDGGYTYYMNEKQAYRLSAGRKVVPMDFQDAFEEYLEWCRLHNLATPTFERFLKYVTDTSEDFMHNLFWSPED